MSLNKIIIILGFLIIPQSVGAVTYYIDFVNGLDTNSGLSTTTAWQSLDQFADNARSAGDTAFVRRGMASTTNVTDLTFSSDGTLNNPITISADYDNAWSDFASSTATWTPTFGSKFIASSASSTDFATPNKWIYLQGDCYERSMIGTVASSTNPCAFAYEVASTSPAGIDLYLPYKGNQTGSGVNMRVMPSAPQWNTTTGDFQWTMSSDDYWVFKGIDVRGTDSACNLTLTSNRGTFLFDMILQGNGVSDCGASLGSITNVYKHRSFGQVAQFNNYEKVFIIDALLDCNLVGSSNAFTAANGDGYVKGMSIEVTRCVTFINGSATQGFEYFFSNLKHNNIYVLTGVAVTDLYFEDSFGEVGHSFQSSNKISANLISTTTTATSTQLRAGGGLRNYYISPPSGTGNTGLSTRQFPFSYIKLFEYPIYTDTSSKTYTMYFRAASTSAFTVDPFTNTQTSSSTPELYIECEYYNDASDADRILTRSNVANDVDFTGNIDWQDISVTCQPTQSGVLWLRGWYAKPKESPTNQFYMDTQPEII